MTSSASERLAGLGLALPPPPKPVGSYSPVVVEGRLAFVSGQISTKEGKVVHPGLVGREVSVELAKTLARDATLQALSAIASVAGSLDRIVRIVRVTVYVAGAAGFDRPHEVANGATDLLIELFGEAGRPARAAIGVFSLPLNAPVEVELIAAVS